MGIGPVWPQLVGKVPNEVEQFLNQLATIVNSDLSPRVTKLEKAIFPAGSSTTVTATISSAGNFVQGGHASRSAFSNYPTGTLFWETDRTAMYLNTGAAWIWVLGTMSGTLSPNQKPMDLGTSDAGFLFEGTDFDRKFEWTGSAWVRAAGEPPAGLILTTNGDETPGAGWHLCDGSVVNRTNSSGGLQQVTLPNYSTAAYLKIANAASVGPNAASGTTGSTTLTTTAVQSGAGTTVVTQAAHTHTPGTQELRNTVLIAWYRL